MAKVQRLEVRVPRITEIFNTGHASGMLSCFMANLQVKNVPEEVHDQLRKVATRTKKTLGQLVLDAIRHELERISFQESFSERKTTNLGTTAALLLQEERAEYDEQPTD